MLAEDFDAGLGDGIRVAVRDIDLTRWDTSEEIEIGRNHCRLQGVFYLAYLGQRVAKAGQQGTAETGWKAVV